LLAAAAAAGGVDAARVACRSRERARAPSSRM